MMKQFKDLVPGDVIYYYSHCRMYPKTVVTINVNPRVEHYQWGDRTYYDIDITCDKGKPMHMTCSTYGNYTRYGLVFASKEAAQMELDRLREMRTWEINKQKKRINKFERYLEKYGFAK